MLFMFFCIVGLVELVFGFHFVETHLDLLEEEKCVACGMYFNENDFSAFLSVLTIYMLFSGFKRIVKLIFVCFAFVIICVNQSIICVLGLASFALIAYIIAKKRNKTFRFISVLILILILIKPGIDLINSSSLWWRSYMYSLGIQNVLSHMLFGTGIGKYSEGMFELGFNQKFDSASADPHNLFYELAGTFGIIWSILLIVLLFKLIVWNIKRASIKENLFCFGLVYIIPFVGLASSSCMEKNYIYLALLIPLLYYRFFNCNSETVVHVKRYLAFTKS